MSFPALSDKELFSPLTFSDRCTTSEYSEKWSESESSVSNSIPFALVYSGQLAVKWFFFLHLLQVFPTGRTAFFLHGMFLCTDFTHQRFIFVVRLFILRPLTFRLFFLYRFHSCTLSSSSSLPLAFSDRQIATVSFKISFPFCRSTFLVLASFMPNPILSFSWV